MRNAFVAQLGKHKSGHASLVEKHEAPEAVAVVLEISADVEVD